MMLPSLPIIGVADRRDRRTTSPLAVRFVTDFFYQMFICISATHPLNT